MLASRAKFHWVGWVWLLVGVLGPTAATAQPVPQGPPKGATLEARNQWLNQQIEIAVAARPALAKSRVGVAVIDVTTGKMAFGRLENEPFLIASVAKVVTTAAALSLLGPEYRFKTTLYADRLQQQQTVRGNLYLRGGGDPTLTTTTLQKLVSNLKLLGVRRITGSLVIDDSRFDDKILPPAFDQKNETGAYRAPIGAASLNYNAIAVRVQPGRLGGPARVLVEPPSNYITLTSSVTTVRKGRNSLRVISRAAGNKMLIDVRGTIRVESNAIRIRRRIERPTLYLGETLLAMLRANGIRVRGKRIKRGNVPRTARVLTWHTSDPLSVIVRDLNKFSNNFMAEMVLKALGGAGTHEPATSARGAEAVRAYLRGVGLKRSEYRYENGSGLYDSNRFSPLQVTRVLRHAFSDFRYSADFVAALSLAGADGTIGHRMVDAPAERLVRAKTGTLDGVSCLSGFAGAVGKPPLAFAVLVNDVPKHWRGVVSARGLQDDIANLLVLYLR